ncbi:tyrosine-type recombinase/integrase [Pelotomaculum sp. FP]|uniref:tyrosine-type recombinase/integrase n=1 Tax=Pelotomaculum sp. FP TaxID=261474 RepID=UPI00249DFA7A|nr:tyrosine-type recombinase/integrase [Pelotomaculum sp. FP]
MRNGKGGKDKFAILSQSNLNVLRQYYRAYWPKEWLFYSRNQTGTHITSRATQNIFNKYKDIAGIKKKCSTHTLRHPYVKYTPKNY